MQRTLSLDSLGELDNGNSRAIIDATIRRAVEDLDDRGDDGKARTVEIKIEMKKIDGGLTATLVHAGCKLPAYQTNGTVMRHKVVNGQSRLLFQQLAPDNPDQRTIDDALPDGEVPPHEPFKG